MTIRDTCITIRTGYTFSRVFRIIHNELHVCMGRICVSWIPHIIDEKRPGILQTAILHHDNTPSHRATQNTETIKRLSFELLDHHPYLTHPTWPLVIFFSFSIDQVCLKGTGFEDIADLLVTVQKAIPEIPVNLYRKCFLSWVKRCRKCVDYKGHYFERE